MRKRNHVAPKSKSKRKSSPGLAQRARAALATEVIGFERLEAVAGGIVDSFSGDLLIYNVELNTLKNTRLWTKFCSSPRVKKIQFALPPHIMKRLERELSISDNIAKTLDLANGKLEFFAISLDPAWKRTAFALFLDTAVNTHSTCILFPKCPPFSRLDEKDREASDRWYYSSFVKSSNPELNTICRNWMLKDIEPFKTEPISFEDIKELAAGRPLDPLVLAARHRLGTAKAEELNRLVSRSGTIVKGSCIDQGEGHKQFVFPTPRAEVDAHPCKLKVFGIDEARPKPFLLWLPPWGLRTAWQTHTQTMDNELLKEYVIGHLEYANNPVNYTFTGAEMDARDVIAWASNHAEEIGVRGDCTVIVGVSVNAFLAADIARTTESVKALCLLMPGIDLFDSVDNLLRDDKSVEMFTRRVYLGKKPHTADDGLRAGVKYFGRAKMSVYHLLDLALRGTRCCGQDYFEKNLGEFVERGGHLMIGHSKQDSMTSWESVLNLCARANLEDALKEIYWQHDLRSGLRYSEPVIRPDGGQGATKTRVSDDGIEEIVRWLKEGAKGAFCGARLWPAEAKGRARLTSDYEATDGATTRQRDYGAFVPFARDEMKTADFMGWAGGERVTLAIVFTDVASSTKLTDRLKDDRMNDLRRAHFAQSRRLIKQYKGREIKTIGDSFMVAFRSVEQALDYAIALKANPGEEGIQIRAGIHIGPMQVEENDVFGGTVNFAARVVGAIKDATEIWVSDQAKEHLNSYGARQNAHLLWDRHDSVEMKGFQGSFTLWSLHP